MRMDAFAGGGRKAFVAVTMRVVSPSRVPKQ